MTQGMEPPDDGKSRVPILNLIMAWLAMASFAAVTLQPFGYAQDARNLIITAASTLVLAVVAWLIERRTLLLKRLRDHLSELLLERAPLLIQRMYRTLDGSSKIDFAVDLGRLIGILGLIIIPIRTHGIWAFTSGGGIIFGLSSMVLILTLVAPYLRKKTRWDVTYNWRKARLTTAINYAAVFLKDPSQRAAIRNMEANALLAIKSYLEFSVLDTEGHNFSVNLIVRNPHNPRQLVCINRASGGEFPKYYPEGFPEVVMRAMDERQTVYNGRFVSQRTPPKPFKTIWQIPICFPPGENTECIGLLAIDSLKPRHLDVKDNREALLFNLSTYIAILRYALLLREEQGYWE